MAKIQGKEYKYQIEVNKELQVYKSNNESFLERQGTIEPNKIYYMKDVYDPTWYEIVYPITGFVPVDKVNKSLVKKITSLDKEETKAKSDKMKERRGVVNTQPNPNNKSKNNTSSNTTSGSNIFTDNTQTVASDSISEQSDLDTSNLTYEPDLNKYDIGSNVESYLSFKQINGVFGMPYQYTPTVDRRLSGSKDPMEYGRKFSEKILMQAPLVFMTPGRPQFMSGYSDEYKQKVMQRLYDMGVTNDEALVDEDGRYYTFKFAYDEYYTYVNTMIQRAACILGIGDEKFQGTPLSKYNWAEYKNDELNVYISGSEYTCFYAEAENTQSESFGNSTGDSSIASSINQLSDLGKEAAFLMGNAAGIELDTAIKSGYNSNLEAFSNFFNKWGGNGAASVANKLFGGVSSLAMGGHLAFPEIWKDSDYTQSYNVSIKLATPDGDKYSQFINVMVPYYHLLGFVLPQALGYNGYTSPFLVRACFGGAWNCEMGIITSMDVSKGPSWNQYKMPTEMTIQFTIKDLYKALAMTNEQSTSKFLKHSQYVDFLANSVGVNINIPEIGRQLNMYKNFMMGHKVSTVIDNMQNSMSNFLSNQVSKIKILF